jgi:diacylglycerol O-acyltransferase
VSGDGAATHRPERELQFEQAMSPAEAVMWKVDGDPWLRPIAGTLVVLDRPVDFGLFERYMRHAVVEIPRLRERVVAGAGLLSAPVWAPDADFDMAHHLRHVALPRHAKMADLQQLVSRWYEDPFDLTRPLWEFIVVDGVHPGRGALFWKVHHTISDGMGLVRLSERFMQAERDAPAPPEVDLEGVVARAAAATRPSGSSGRLSSAARRSVAVGWLPVTAGRWAAVTAARTALDPAGAVGAAQGAVGAVRGAVGQLSAAPPAPGSPLWRSRSARRHLESMRIPLDAARQAGKMLGGSINDVFVTGAVEGVLAYHAKRDVPVPFLNFSFVVSQRTGAGVGGNFFTPRRAQVPGGPASVEERFAMVRDRMAVERHAAAGASSVAGLARMAQALPASVVRRTGRAQVAGVDFATSNLRGAPFPLYISGAGVLDTTTMGPVSGTAFNLTTISYDGDLHMGLLVDPVAVDDPVDLRVCIEEAYAQLLTPPQRGRRAS